MKNRMPITFTRAWRLVTYKAGPETINILKAHRSITGRSLRDAIADLTRKYRRVL